jgi:hypothetical protein
MTFHLWSEARFFISKALERFVPALLMVSVLMLSVPGSVQGNTRFTVAFQSASSSVVEGVGTTSLTLVLAGPGGQTLTSPVDATVTFLDGSTSDGPDFAITTGTVTFTNASVDLSDNGQWGLHVEDGVASLNSALSTTAPMVTANSNGTGASCFDWTVQTGTVLVNPVACAGGGVRVDAGALNVGLLTASANASDGVQVLNDVDGFTLTASNNQGDGVVSSAGSVGIDIATASDNTGAGVDAGVSVVLKQGEVCRNGAGGVIAQETVAIDQVLVCSNTGDGVRVKASTASPSAFVAGFATTNAVGAPSASTITGSTLIGNTGHGLHVQSALGMAITGSSITGNTGSGVLNATGGSITATNSWWGDASGPGGGGPGTGDEVTGPANFSGFLASTITVVATLDPATLTISTGGSGEARLFVRNGVNATDTVGVTVTDPRGWLANATSFNLPLTAGIAETTLTFNVPGGTANGTLDSVTGGAASQATPAHSTSATMTVKTPGTAPPPPLVPAVSSVGLAATAAALALLFAWQRRRRLAR